MKTLPQINRELAEALTIQISELFQAKRLLEENPLADTLDLQAWTTNRAVKTLLVERDMLIQHNGQTATVEPVGTRFRVETASAIDWADTEPDAIALAKALIESGSSHITDNSPG